MSVDRTMLITELQALRRLTAVEQSIATVRRAQARTADLERELRANAERASERIALLADAVRGLDAVPDAVGTALGRIGGYAATQVNQVQSLQGALLGDLALEHDLLARTRYARTLATTLGESAVLPVLDRLEQAHTETVAWLEERLDEVGRTGTSLLAATPVQAVVGALRSAAGVPLGLLAGAVNQAGALVARRGREAVDVVEQAGAAAAGAAGSARDAVLAQVQGVASEGATTVAELAEEAAESAAGLTGISTTGDGGVAAPFAGYDRLTGERVIGHVRESEDVAELEQTLAFETAHKARPGVLAAVGERLAALAVGVS